MTSETNPFKVPPPYLPTTAVVQASGGAFNPDPKDPSTGEQGTLGVRVSQQHDTRYLFISTAHTSPHSIFQWLYTTEKGVKVGPTGRIVKRIERIGPETPLGEIPIVDCALVRLDSTAPKDVTSGVLQGPMQRPRAVKGKGIAKTDMFVSMFGVTTGLTYGRVIPLFSWLPKTYGVYLFFVQLCNEQGLPLDGEFGEPGDSGATILDENGYVLGMYIGNIATESPGNRLGVVTRFEQIEVALEVKLSQWA